MLKKKWMLALALGLVFAGTAAAQQDVRGQMFLPDGSPPNEPIRFSLTRDDGMVNDIRFTDSNGRFILERLNARVSYTITVDGDGRNYGSTTYSFVPAYSFAVRVTLSPLLVSRKPAAPSTVSVASSYKPLPDAQSAYDKAMKEVKNSRPDAAEPLFRQAINADRKFVAAYNDLGVLLMQQRKYADAETVLDEAVQVDPKSVHALLNLGITRNHLQKYGEAIPALREVLRLEPGLGVARLHLGIALVETDQLKDADQELLRASKSTGADEATTQLYIGKLCARTGDFEKSITSLNAYLLKVPNAPNAPQVHALIDRMQKELAARK